MLDAAVVGEPDQERGERIVAHVVLLPGGCPRRLEAFCARELPRHLRPARFRVRQAIPTLASGKHDLAAVQGLSQW